MTNTGACGGPSRADHVIARQLQAARLRPFLQCRLGILRRRRLAGIASPQARRDEAARRLQAAIQIQRADQRLHRVGQHRRALAHAGAWLPRATPTAPPAARAARRSRPAPAARPDGRAAGRARPPARRETLGQPLGDQQAEHPVADEFQPLVRAGAAGRAVRRSCPAAAERWVSASRSRSGRAKPWPRIACGARRLGPATGAVSGCP